MTDDPARNELAAVIWKAIGERNSAEVQVVVAALDDLIKIRIADAVALLSDRLEQRIAETDIFKAVR